METATNVSEGINTSIYQNCTILIEWDDTFEEFCIALTNVWDEECCDYTCENDGSYDVWGWSEDEPEKQIWRLNVRCSKAIEY